MKVLTHLFRSGFSASMPLKKDRSHLQVYSADSPAASVSSETLAQLCSPEVLSTVLTSQEVRGRHAWCIIIIISIIFISFLSPLLAAHQALLASPRRRSRHDRPTWIFGRGLSPIATSVAVAFDEVGQGTTSKSFESIADL